MSCFWRSSAAKPASCMTLRTSLMVTSCLLKVTCTWKNHSALLLPHWAHLDNAKFYPSCKVTGLPSCVCLTSAVSLRSATVALCTPACALRARSTAEEQDEQCIPLTETCMHKAQTAYI